MKWTAFFLVVNSILIIPLLIIANKLFAPFDFFDFMAVVISILSAVFVAIYPSPLRDAIIRVAGKILVSPFMTFVVLIVIFMDFNSSQHANSNGPDIMGEYRLTSSTGVHSLTQTEPQITTTPSIVGTVPSQLADHCWGPYGHPTQQAVYDTSQTVVMVKNAYLLPVPSDLINHVGDASLHHRLEKSTRLDVVGRIFNRGEEWLFVSVQSQYMAQQIGFVKLDWVRLTGNLEAIENITIAGCDYEEPSR